MNAFKRFFALILSLCMVLSFVPVSAFAAEGGTAAAAPAGVSGATEPFPLSLMTQHGNSGGHFRIPAIVTLDDGTLVAAADARWQSWDSQDDNGNIDTVVSYSKDNGATWEVTFANYFTCSTPYAENWGSPTIIDPGVVTDGEKVYMIADLFPGQSNGAGNCSANAQYAVGYDDQGRMLLRANASTNDTGYYLGDNTVDGVTGYKIYATDGTEQAGYNVDAYFNLYQDGTYVRNLFEYSTTSFMPIMTPHLYLTVGTFDANGVLNWSEPTMLNPVLRSASEKYYLVSPGRGIMTKDDVLVIGGYGNASGGEKASIIFFDGENWHRSSSEASSVSSESEIVELSDGTLRMFARHSGNGNYVQYIDWTPVYTDGKVTDYTPSAAVNTAAVAHNNTNVTAISYSKTSGGKQVILVSCPGDTSGAWTRLNGKIFTFVVDPSTKAMTLVNTVEVNGASEAYSYSCLTELADGTVGLLYEKGDGGNITYAEYDAEELTGLEFDGTYDIFVFGAVNTEGEVKVKKTAGVTHIHTQPNTSLSGVDGDYVAYDVVLCTDAKDGCSGFDCTSIYTGEATVTIPITDALAAEDLKGFVVNSDGSLDYVMDVTVNTINDVKLATFKAPHFSTVGVTAKTPEESASVQKDVTVKVGGTYVDTLKGVNLTGSNAGQASAATATVTWTGTETVVTYPTAQLGSDANYNGEPIDLNDCLYTFTKNSDNTWVVSAEIESGTVYINPHAGASNGGKPNRNYVTNITLVAGTDGAIKFKRSTDDSNGDVGFLHFWDDDATKCYWDQCTSDNCTGHNLLIYKVADTSNTTTILGGYYTQVTDIANLVSGEQYLIVAKHNNGSYYVMHPTTSGNSDKYAHVAKVTGQTATRSEYETAVVIEGVTEGTTSVAIGDTLYNITVDGEIKKVVVGLKVGETTTIEDNTGYYIPTYTGKGLNESVATVTLSGTTTDVAQDVADTGVTAIQSGKQYAIVCKRSATNGAAGYDPENSVLTNDLNGSSLHMNGPLADDTTEVWTITQDGNGYTVQDVAGKYLTFGNNGENVSVSDTKTVLTLTYNADGGYWRIYNNGYWLSDKYGAANENALAYNQENDDGNNWVIYEVTPAHTDGTTSIVIKGVAEGETSVVVGNTQYNIIVNSNIPECFVMRNVSTATVVNTLPTLPAKVCGVLQDGSLVKDANGGNYQYTVEWDAITADMFDTAGEIVTVNGTVAFDDGTTKPVTCTVRVAPAPAASADIIDSNTTLTEDLPSGVSAADNLQSLKDGNTAPGEGTNDRWSNWNYRSGYTSATITLDWGSVKTIDQVKLYFRDDNGCDLPTSVTFQYSEDGVTYRDISSSKTDVTAINKTYALNEAVDARYLKVVLGHNDGRGVALYEIEVFTAAVGDLTYNNSADLSNLTVDGSTVAGFDPDVLQYDVAAYRGTVAAATEDTVNAGITILPVYEGVVRVLTVSEDGTEAKTYEITFDTDSLAQVDVPLKVGETTTLTDNTGNYQNKVDRTDLDEDIARVEVVGNETAGTKSLVELTSLDQIVSGKSYLIVTAVVENGSGVATDALKVVKAEAFDNTNTTLKLGDAPSISSTDLWTFTESNGTYTISQNGLYLNLSNTAASLSSTPQAITLGWRTGSDYGRDIVGCTFAVDVNGTTYYLDHNGNFGEKAGVWNAAGTGSTWRIYEIVTEGATATTNITITGVSDGDTSVIVGNTKYNIHVTGLDPVTVNVNLVVGQSKDYEIDGAAYDSDDVTINDNTVANVTVQPQTEYSYTKGNQISAQADLVVGRKYVLNNNLSGKNLINVKSGSNLTLGGTIDNIAENAVWTLVAYNASTGVAKLQDCNGKYLTVGAGSANIVDGENEINLVYRDAGHWNIAEDGHILNNASGSLSEVHGWTNCTQPDHDNCKWSIYEVTTVSESSTQVSIKGLKSGTTTATVGHVTYNITVKDMDPVTVDVVLKLGETKPFYIEGVAYTDADVDPAPNTTIADMTVFGHTPDDRLTLTDEIKSGREYLIVVNNRDAGNNATHNTLTYSAHVSNTNYLTLYNNYTQANTYWVIEKAPGDANKFYVKTPYGSYLAIESAKAYTTDIPTALDLVYDAAGYWTIAGNNQYLNQYTGVDADYAAGHHTVDDNSHWEIYERTENDHTQVVFTGMDIGTTTAKVGHVTYNITVAADTRDVEIFVGETWKDVQDGVNATGSNAGQNSSNIADVTWQATNTYAVVARVMDTSGGEDGDVNLADAELTFTKANGKYTILSGTNAYMNIIGYPFHVDTADSPATNTAITLTFDDDGAVRLMNDAGHYLQVYNGNGNLAWTYKTTVTGTISSDDFEFYIYAPATDAADSSAEVPGYYRITDESQIVSGQKYLIAFAKNGTYYVAYNNGDNGTSNFENMARLNTTVTGSSTEVTVVGKNPGNTKVQVGDVLYNITVKPYEKNIAIEIGSSASYTPAGDVTQEAIDAFNAAYGTYVTVALVNGKLVFTGVAEGVVNQYLLAGTLYNIKVTKDVVDGDDSKYVGGQSGTQGEGQVITGLIVSNDTVYDLNMAADVVGNITWESSDENVFTIDEQTGTVTSGSNAGEAYVNVYVDGNLYQTIPVIVIETAKQDGNNREIDVYNKEVLNCTAYYTYNKEDIAIFPEGYQFYAIHSKAETDLIAFYATPNEGYALSYVNGTGGTYFHLVTNPEGTGYLTDSGTHADTHKMKDGGYQTLHDQLIAYVVNNSGSYAADLATVHKMLDQAVLLEIDGAFFYSRGTGTADLNDTTFFVAEKLPEVDKAVNGLLGVSGLKVDWQLYQEGMYAEVGELVYFTISIEMDEPIYWERALNDQNKPYKPAEGSDVFVDSEGYAVKVDANGNPYALMQYTNASLEDFMDGAYFYTKEQDEDDDVDGDGIFYEGFLAESEQQTVQDVTAALNATWTAEERAAHKRVLEYFVVYEIKPDDVNTEVQNTVRLEYSYSSAYSHGSASNSGDAEASLKVLGNSLGDLLIDFGLPIEMTGLTTRELPGITADNMDEFQENTNNVQGGCQYGTVTFRQETDGTYTLIYTPNEVMAGYDVIYIMDHTNTLRNYVRVRPATTIYYEESFAALGNAIAGDNDSGWTEKQPVSGTQEYQHANCDCDNHNNFGYDGKYAAETRKSNGTEVASSKSGDTATFTFTGTGFDLYANCDPASSVVAVMVYRLINNSDGTVSEKLTKYYQVATKTKVGDTPATADQAVDADGCAIVSVTDLAHGTYKVIVRHTKRTDGSDTAVFYMDGFRIYNTVENSDQYYPAEEQRVTFTELRDEVLFAAGVTADSSQTYQNGSNIVSETANGATVAFLRNEDGNIAANVTDWLNNGPKNEIWMMEDDNLAFTLYAGDATTQAGAVAYAQIGLKAPTGYAKVTIYLYNGKTLAASGQYEITSATDMFYDLPTPANGMVNGMSVTIVVEEGLLSVTKLKTNVYEGGVATNVLMPMDDYQVASALNLIYGVTDDGDDTTNPGDGTTTDPSDPDDGTTTDPSNPDDGTTTDPSNPDDGETTDPSDPTGDDLEDSYKDSYNNTVTRIFGENRFETAFKVADELKAVLGVEKFENIIVACGSNFADALSGTYLASVKNAPILLSYTEQYNELVLDYIAENLAEDGTVYILGGNSAVPYTMDLALIAEDVAYKRLAGANRFETNLLILAEAGVEKEEVLVCTGSNFADSLSASATGKPILLVYNESGELTLAQKLYLALLDDCTFTVIGGEKAVCPELEKAVAEYGETKRLAGADRFETSVEIAKTYFENPEAVVLAYAANYPDGLCGGALAYAIEAPLVLTMTGYEADADLYVFDIKAEGGLVLGGSGLIADDSIVDIFDLEKPQEIIVK